jgi:hypothetical protein
MLSAALALLLLADEMDPIRELLPKGAMLPTRDSEILQRDERFRSVFADARLAPDARVRAALDDPLSVPGAATSLAQSAWSEVLFRDVFLRDAPAPRPAATTDPIEALRLLAGRLAERLREAGCLDGGEAERRLLPRWVSRSRPEEVERAKRGEEDEKEREEFLQLAQRRAGDRRFEAAAAELVLGIEALLPGLRAMTPPAGTRTVESDLGPILLRGTGNDGGDCDAFLLVDCGGDDEYVMPAKPVDRALRILIDLGGNDLYLANGPHAWGSALLGISLLVDCGGNDDYRGRDWSLGCGLGGVGLLWDQAGDDRYYGGLGSQGVGIFGIGLLRDDGGDDEYVADCYGQGFASSGGEGALVDLSGNDLYVAGRDEEDIWRRPATYVTFAQGAAYSHRFGTVYQDEKGGQRFRITGQIPGGVGMLLDREGNDRYLADVFGQGSAYWYSLGLLVDGAGDDFYRATWYGQGVGTHCAVGCVVDRGGNDRYLSRTTSQGCGHDFSAGILHDLSGDDRYEGVGLCQGAGNALSGLGVLLDGGGEDAYRCSDRCWGFGADVDRHPEAAPWGLFADLGGTNVFHGPLAPGREWVQGARGRGRQGE